MGGKLITKVQCQSKHFSLCIILKKTCIDKIAEILFLVAWVNTVLLWMVKWDFSLNWVPIVNFCYYSFKVGPSRIAEAEILESLQSLGRRRDSQTRLTCQNFGWSLFGRARREDYPSRFLGSLSKLSSFSPRTLLYLSSHLFSSFPFFFFEG